MVFPYQVIRRMLEVGVDDVISHCFELGQILEAGVLKRKAQQCEREKNKKNKKNKKHKKNQNKKQRTTTAPFQTR